MTASLAPRIQNDFDFGDSELGLAIAICYAVSALSSTPLGRLAERIGAARGMLLATTLTTTSCIAVATLAQSATSMTALLVLAGPANASTAPAVSALLQAQV
ncbi:MAG: MFS transporter, partial [Actinomycetota bacterium]|nr:MFS transporter [Actinomycetota bacterium]